MIDLRHGMVACLTQANAPFGMLQLDDLVERGSPGDHPDHLYRSRLRSLLNDVETSSRALATAIGPEAMPRSHSLFSLLPSARGHAPEAVCAWRASGGATLVASTIQLLTLLGDAQARFAAFASRTRTIEIERDAYSTSFS